MGVWLACSAQAAGRQRGRAIQFTPSKSDEVLTNLHQLRNKKDSLKRLEEDLNAPLQNFTPRSSLEGVVAPPPRSAAPSAVQSKRAKELLERRKNWVFMTPDELLGGPTVEQILQAPDYGADGRLEKDLPAMESYYERLLPKRPAKNIMGQAQTDELFSLPNRPNSLEAPANDDSDLPAGIRESADALQNAFRSDDNSSPYFRSATATDFSDPFRLGGRAAPTEQMLEHKKRMDEYRALVDSSWRSPAGANSGFSALSPGGAALSTASPANKLPGVSTPESPRGLEAQLNIREPLLGPPGLPDVNAKALGQSRPTPVVPKVRQTKVATTQPAYFAPKRAF
jgi:hypothetical protein